MTSESSTIKTAKLIHINTWDVALGGGMARMDLNFCNHLDRSIVDPVFVATMEKPPADRPVEDVPYIYYRKERAVRPVIQTVPKRRYRPVLRRFLTPCMRDSPAGGGSCFSGADAQPERGCVFDYIDATVCVSRRVKDIQPHPEKTRVIYNGIDPARFPFTQRTGKEGKFVILQVSDRVKPKIHLDEMADEILVIDPRIELRLAGFGQTLPSTDRVKYLGVVEDIAPLYGSADMIFQFSRIEAFGLTVAEAMATGCVPLVSDGQGVHRRS